MEDVRQDAAAVANGGEVNGNNNGNANGDSGSGANSERAGGPASLAVPQSVVDEALKVTRESLESICEIEENGAT